MSINKLYEYISPAKADIQIQTDKNQKDLYMSGIFIQGDVKNHNQRVYPASEIVRAVNDINAIIKAGDQVMGELDHPEELSINLDRVSHLITEMWLNDNKTIGYGKLKLLPTPTGEIAKTLLSSGVKLGVSSRGKGSVDDYGMVSNFQIVTVDIVAQPSAPGAYPTAIYESLYNMKGGQILMDLAQNSSNCDSAAKYLKKNISKLIRELKL